ncbi:hypothetical protein [Microlunatus speluncae]|uniref:hypothetical protein n=1 Tax=Microlunatus speluncae TaxID=2594267 RepID=UPI0012665D27|nr:hypothetical protein [Microlunatus speluncae]
MADPDETAGRARVLQLLELGEDRPLTGPEQLELDTLLQRFPGIEFDQFGPELAHLEHAPIFREAAPPPRLRAKIIQAAENDTASRGTSRLRRRIGLAAAAVALVLAGALGQGAIAELARPKPPTGPPGTLGAVEPITFSDAPAGVEVNGAVVAHTWGTETRVEIGGLPVGNSFTVVLVDDNGTEYTAGGFVGSRLPVDCQLNAAVLRADAKMIKVLDKSGTMIMTSALPPA